MRGILSFIAQNPWLLIIVLGGLFNVGVRMHQKVREQRSKRAALAEIQRRKADALRTGKALDEPVIVYDEPQAAKSTQQDERKARIEALRQQRMEQLRAMREKRASTSGATASQLKPLVTQPKPSKTSPQSQSGPQRTSQRTPHLKPKVQPQQRPARPRVVPQASPQGTQRTPARPRVIEPVAKPTPIPDTSPGLNTAAPLPKKIVPGSNPISASKDNLSQGGDLGKSSITARELLRNPRLTRQAIVARELLDAPICNRNPDRAPGSMPG